MKSRCYISENTLRAIASEIDRIVQERKRLGEPPAKVSQLATWIGFDPNAIRRAMEAMRHERRQRSSEASRLSLNPP